MNNTGTYIPLHEVRESSSLKAHIYIFMMATGHMGATACRHHFCCVCPTERIVSGREATAV